MNPQWRRFAPLGLYLAIAAAVTTVGLYIIFKEFNLGVQISLAVVVLGLALFAILDPERIRTIFTGRTAKYGSNALILMLAFLGILIVINYLAYKNSKRWDLTQDKEHTLAAETIDTLKALPQPVVATAYFTSRTPSDTARNLLGDFKANSAGKFDFTFVDPEADPIVAQNAGITQDGTIILSMGTMNEPVTYASEQEITGALLRLVNPGNKVIYFLTGHGEFDTEDGSDLGYSQVKARLVSKNYTVNKLNLLSEQQIPADATVIVIAGPKYVLSDAEVALLSAYALNGGSLVVMEEPTPLTNYGDSPDPLLPFLETNWGIKIGNDFVIDLSVNPPNIAVADSYGNHLITTKLQSVVTIYPTSRSVTLIDPSPDANLQRIGLVQTAQRSWAETDLAGLQNDKITADEGQDLFGPVTIAVAVDNSTTKTRIAVFGDADFTANGYITQYGNGDMFINTVDWAAKQDSLINLTPKQQTQRVLVPPQKYGMGLVLFGSVFLLPGIVIVAGIVVWIRRRRQG